MIPEIVVMLQFICCTEGERMLIPQVLTALLRDLKVPKLQLMIEKKNPTMLCVESHVYLTGLNVTESPKQRQD